MYIVELEKGLWLSNATGEPTTTKAKENAKKYKQKNWAKCELKEARKFRPFLKAKVKLI